MIRCGLDMAAAPLGLTPVQNIFIMEYMPKAPEGYVKAYLYGLMQCGSRTFEGTDMAFALGMEEAELAAAFLYWQDLGLVTVEEGDPLCVTYRMASGGPLPVSQRKYGPLVAALRDAAGTRVFTPQELGRIYDWIEVFGMEEAAAVMLVRRCLDAKGPKAGIAYMDRAAKTWADDGVLTAAAAEERIRDETELQGGAKAILDRWRKKRMATEDELALYRKWTREWGMSEEEILAACPAVTASDKPTFAYLDAILNNMRLGGGVQEFLKHEAMAGELARQIYIRSGMKGAPGRREKDAAAQWVQSWHMSAETALLAAEYAAGATRPFDRTRRIMEGWHEKGITSVEGARKDFAAGEQKRENGKKSYFMNHPQRRYSDEEIAGMGINLLAGEEDK